MKNGIKKSLFIVVACLLASEMWGQVNSFTAAEIVSGTQKGAVTASQNSFAIKNQAQICKTGSQATKADVVEGNSSAGNVDEKYVQFEATSDISKLYLHATYNSSGNGKKMVFVYWGEGVTPAYDNIISSELVTFPGYDKACDANYVEVTPPTGTRTIRIYRQLKNFDGTGYKKSTNYGDNTTFFIVDADVTAGPPPASTDATLSGLTYDGTTVPNFSAATLQYEVELPTGSTEVPSVVGTANESHANVVVTPAESLPGTTTIVVTAEDETTTKTYSITFTVASADPKVWSATWNGIMGSAAVDNVNYTITGKVQNGTGLNAITPSFTGNNIDSWSPEGAQDFSNGAVDYTFTSPTGETITYAVTITEAPAVSSDATLSALSVGGYTISFDANTLTYNITLKSGSSSVPSVSYTVNDPNATVVKTDAQSIPGVTTIEVTAEDGITVRTYTINFNIPVPQSSLTLHEPEIYEAGVMAGGYNTPLKVSGQREYEVYYTLKGKINGSSVATIATTPSGTYLTDASSKANDGWFAGNPGSMEENGASAVDEFVAGSGNWKMKNNEKLELHIKGYDEFAILAADNDASDAAKQFHIYLNGSDVTPKAHSTSPTVRRVTLAASQEYVLRVEARGSSQMKFYGFSLRVAQEPRTRWLKGNDSTQTILQTTSPKPVYYYTKYNSKGETRLEWEGAEATGITLSTLTSEPIGDTLVLSGAALCPTGTYTYYVVSYFNGIETRRVKGSFTVTSEIKPTTELDMATYQNEEMDQIKFRYYALSEEDILLNWTNGQPDGINGTANNGTYIIGGTPLSTGTFPYTITVNGADTTYEGVIEVSVLDLGNDPILYLYKKKDSYQTDGVYKYLTTGTKKRNVITRRAKEDGPRASSQYQLYKWIIISADADADNPEVLSIIRDGSSNLPVLNLNGFTYARGRLDWGAPNNGTIDTVSKNASNIYIQRADHPIFQKFNGKKRGDAISILDLKPMQQGVMPIKMDVQGINSLCLATAYTRDIDDYMKDGELQTVLHELPAESRGGQKYICLPLAKDVTLSPDGEKLIDGIVDYLLTPNETPVAIPTLAITGFVVEGVAGTIDNTIDVAIDATQYPDFDLTTVAPTITLADPEYSFVTPASGDTIDFQYSTFLPVEYVVTDYINRVEYKVTVRVYKPQGIEEVYAAGEWVTIYDVYGRMMTTTNESIYTMALPQGMYIAVRANGETIKIIR